MEVNDHAVFENRGLHVGWRFVVRLHDGHACLLYLPKQILSDRGGRRLI